MKKDQKKIRYENQVTEIIDKSIKFVRYIQIDYEERVRYWENEHFHSVDFGVELEMEDEICFKVEWASEFFPYNINLSRGTLKDKLSGGVAWNVTNHPNWTPLLHKKVVDVKVYWSWVETENKRIDYPKDLEIIFFDGKKVYFSASQYFEDRDKLFGLSDEVTVIFSDIIAQRYKLGSYALTNSKS